MKTRNLRQQVFIREMIIHGDRQQAYQTAYPNSSAKAAYDNACCILSHPDIYREIWLARIKRGKKLFPKLSRVKGKLVVLYTEASPAQLLSATDLDTRLESAMKPLIINDLWQSDAYFRKKQEKYYQKLSTNGENLKFKARTLEKSRIIGF